MKKNNNMKIIIALNTLLVLIVSIFLWLNYEQKVFHNNTDCSAYKDNIEKELDELWKDQYRGGLNIFYSSKLQSCIYAFNVFLGYNFCDSEDERPCFPYDRIARNYSTNEFLFSDLDLKREIWSCKKTGYPEKCLETSFEKEINKLKK